MKVILYAVETAAGIRPLLSVAWQVDRLYWTNDAFRRGVAEGWPNLREDAQVRGIVWLQESVPLGLAEAACARLDEVWKSGNRENPRADLQNAICWAFERAGDREPARSRFESACWNSTSGTPLQVIPDQYEYGRGLAALARRVVERLRGKSLLQAEVAAMLDKPGGDDLLQVLQLAALQGGVRLTASVEPVTAASVGLFRRRVSSRQSCRRCGSGEDRLRRTACASCGRRCAYCEACLTMGRCRECGLLVVGAPAQLHAGYDCSATVTELTRRWGLSPAQAAASSTALRFLGRHAAPRNKRSMLQIALPALFLPSDPRTFLLWAVTGAGKTEMMFPLLAAVLAAGAKAAVATPRRDVVLELAPRLARAFPDSRQSVLYGGSPDRFEAGDLTLTTTHQLIRFREAFDLVVIDELDAFPYHNDPMLHFAAAQARAKYGATVLLSATPPIQLQNQVRQGKLAHARVPVRHHRRPLPLPHQMNVPPLSQWLTKGKIPSKLRKAIMKSIERGAQLFLFVPFIRQVEPLVQLIRVHAARWGVVTEAVDGTSSHDPERSAKVSAFRERKVRLLVTTTILERGVTIPKSDVFVLDADKPLFDASSLVQMAGRAGRSADDPHGFVYFAAAAWTESQRQACKQIRDMNGYARRNGYLSS